MNIEQVAARANVPVETMQEFLGAVEAYNADYRQSYESLQDQMGLGNKSGEWFWNQFQLPEDQRDPQYTAYKQAQVAAQSDYNEQLATLHSEYGVPQAIVDNNKTYYLNVGNQTLDTVAPTTEFGSWATLDNSFQIGDFVQMAVPAILVAAVGGPLATKLGSVFGSASLGKVGTAALTNIAQQAITTGEIDLGNTLAAAATAGIINLADSLPVIGELYQDKSFAGAFTRGSINDLVKQGIQEGSIDLGDAARAGLIQTGFEVGVDVLGDAIQTGNVDRLSRETLNGAPISQQDLDRLADTADLYGLLGPDGALAKLGFDVGYLPTGPLGDLLGSLGFENIRGDFDQAWEQRDERIANGMGVQEANDLYYQEVARYDQRFFNPLQPKGESDFAGIWEENPLAYTGTIISGNWGTEGEGANVPAFDIGVRFDSEGNAFTDTFNFNPDTNTFESPQEIEEEIVDVTEDTVNAADPDIEDPFEDTTQTPDPMVPQDPIVSSPTDPTWGQIDYGPQDGPFEPSSVTSPWSNLRDQMEGGSPGFAVKGEPNQQFWGTEYHMIADLSRMDNEGITEAEREFARQDWDRRIAEGEDPSTWDGGTNGANRENWVLHGWRNNDELRSAIQESGFDNNGQLPPGGQPGGELPPPGGSTDLPPGGSDLPPSGSPLPSAGGLLGTPQGAGTPMPMPGVPNANFVISPKVDIRATDMLAGLLSRYI
jgi:hypothetical protein